MNSKHIIIACVALLCTMQARAQGQDLSVLAANPDARTAAMGNAAVAADGMYLYNNPSAFLCANKKLSADALPPFTRRPKATKEHSDYTPPLWATSSPIVMRHLLASVMLVA